MQGPRRSATQRSMNRALRLSTLPVVLTVLAGLAAVGLPQISGLTPSSSTAGKPRVLTHIALASGSNTWSVQHDGFNVAGIACPSATTCFAIGNVSEGGAISVMNGTTWATPAIVPSTSDLFAVSCPSTSTCFALGQNSSNGLVVEQTTNSAGAWTQIPVSSSGLSGALAISCPTTTTCVVGGTMYDPVYNNNDGATSILTISGGNPSWTTPVKLDGSEIVNGVSCPTTSYCGLIEGTTFENFTRRQTAAPAGPRAQAGSRTRVPEPRTSGFRARVRGHASLSGTAYPASLGTATAARPASTRSRPISWVKLGGDSRKR